MEYVAIAVVLLQIFAISYQAPVKNSSQSIISSFSANLGEELSRTSALQNYIQKKVMEQNHQLAFLLQYYQQNEEAMQKLMKHCKHILEKQKPSENNTPLFPNRRSNNLSNNSTKENANNDAPIVSIVKFGKNIRRYGSLIADMISNEISQQIQPILEVVSSTEINIRISDAKT